MAGNGNSGKRKDKLFHTTLMMALNKAEDAKSLNQIARNLIKVALDTEHKDWLSATKEIANRLDGTPVQAVDLAIDDNRTAREMGDAELAAIAAGGSAGVVDPQDSAEKPDSVH